MHNVTFQLVLKECVLPDYFVFNKLKNLLEQRSEFSDFDMQQARDAIEILRFTNYEGTNRFLLTFSVDFSIADSVSLDYTQKLILAFGNSFRDEAETVEGVFRFEDEFMLDEIIEFHREIYRIEMRIREALNYILAYNFSSKDLFNCIEEFDGIDFGNERMKKDPEHRRKIFNEFLESEIFHIVFTKYGLFKNPKEPKADKIYDFIKRSNSFDELRELMQERGITENLNKYHKIFINDLAANLQQIEDLRNEIMHNREIKESETNNKLTQKTGYKNAKQKFDELIDNFWKQEQNHRVEDLRQVDFILKTLVDSLDFESGDSIIFTDLDFEDQEADDREDLKTQFLDIINEHLNIIDQDVLEKLIDDKFGTLENLELLNKEKNLVLPNHFAFFPEKKDY